MQKYTVFIMKQFLYYIFCKIVNRRNQKILFFSVFNMSKFSDELFMVK